MMVLKRMIMAAVLMRTQWRRSRLQPPVWVRLVTLGKKQLSTILSKHQNKLLKIKLGIIVGEFLAAFKKRIDCSQAQRKRLRESGVTKALSALVLSLV